MRPEFPRLHTENKRSTFTMYRMWTPVFFFKSHKNIDDESIDLGDVSFSSLLQLKSFYLSLIYSNMASTFGSWDPSSSTQKIKNKKKQCKWRAQVVFRHVGAKTFALNPQKYDFWPKNSQIWPKSFFCHFGQISGFLVPLKSFQYVLHMFSADIEAISMVLK